MDPIVGESYVSRTHSDRLDSDEVADRTTRKKRKPATMENHQSSIYGVKIASRLENKFLLYVTPF